MIGVKRNFQHLCAIYGGRILLVDGAVVPVKNHQPLVEKLSILVD